MTSLDEITKVAVGAMNITSSDTSGTIETLPYLYPVNGAFLVNGFLRSIFGTSVTPINSNIPSSFLKDLTATYTTSTQYIYPSSVQISWTDGNVNMLYQSYGGRFMGTSTSNINYTYDPLTKSLYFYTTPPFVSGVAIALVSTNFQTGSTIPYVTINYNSPPSTSTRKPLIKRHR